MHYLKNLIILITVLVFGALSVSGQENTQETIWFQLNREIFLVGEQIKFRAELLDLYSYQPSGLSNSIRVELIDNDGNIISRQNLGLINSSTSGSIDLPLSIPSGWYYIRSYTNWMRNFSNDNMTILPVRVLSHNDITDKSLICKKEELTALLIPHSSLNKNMRADYSIFTSYQNSIPVQSAGIAMNHFGDTLFKFSTDKSGWGLVETNHILSEGNLIISTTDSIHPDISIESAPGFTKRDGLYSVIEKKHGYLSIAIPNYKSAVTYKLLLHRQQSYSWFDSLQLEEGELVFRIPLRAIPAGISQISLFEDDNNLVHSRLWSDFDESVKSVEIDLNNNKLDTDSSYSFEYLLSGVYPEDTVSNMSLLIEQTNTGYNKSDNIPGLPGWVANNDIPSGKEAFEAWLNSSIYPDWIPESFLPPGYDSPVKKDSIWTEKSFEYKADSGSDIIQGKLRGSSPDVAIEGVYLGLTILSSNDLFATTSNRNGKFQFELSGNQGKQDFVLGFIESSNESISIELESNFCEEMDFKRSGEIIFTEEEFNFLREQNITFQLKRIYEDLQVIKEKDDSITGTFHLNSELSINPSNYIDLPDIESLFYEAIPALSVKQDDNNTRYIQVNTLKNETGIYPSLVLVDGLVYNNNEALLDCSPKAIDSINIITGLYIHGSTVFDGVVSFISKEGNLGGLRLPSETILSSIILPVRSIDKNKNAGLGRLDNNPWLEEVIAWEYPGKDLFGKIIFNTNDIPGLYQIRIYGYDRDGRWHSGTKRFDISID